jgi:hypothetical protein
LDFLKNGDEAALKALIKEHSDAVPEGFAEAGLTMEKRIEAQTAYLKILDTLFDNPPPIPPRAMIPGEGDEPADEFIRLAGQFDRTGERVPRGFLRVLGDSAPNIPAGQSGRVELAKWLTDVDGGAGRLAARILANRVWHHLIGAGIVRTVDNFGRTGETPSHPELLDYLACELIESGWSTKELVRKIALSQTFMMSSRIDEANFAVDPDNRLLWRAHRRRLDPESLRDAMLSAAGQLDLRPMESSVWYLDDQATAVGDNKNRRRTDFLSRSIYLPVIRNDLPELFDVFDFADPHATTGMRSETMVATQSLFILNDDSVMAAADATAQRLLAEKTPNEQELQQIDRMIELVLNRSNCEQERQELLVFVANVRKRLTMEGHADAELRAWSMACHALFASSRFQILE